jgi:hypothetical protein
LLKVPRLSLVEGVAHQVLREEKITALPVCPFTIAEGRGIRVLAKPPGATDGFSGVLVRKGNAFGILYATHIESEGFRRFSVAHELGHYFLPDHPEHVLRLGHHGSRSGFELDDPYEQEADFFAAALLMPSHLFCKAALRFEDGVAAVIGLAAVCRTSLPATAIAYAKHSPSAVAVILSTGGVVDCCFLSEAMKSARVRWIRKGTAVPRGTLTHTFAKDRSSVSKGDEEWAEVDLIDWLDSPNSHVVQEHVVGLGSYGKILTILYSRHLTVRHEADLDDDEDDEDSLIERWTPRFRS